MQFCVHFPSDFSLQKPDFIMEQPSCVSSIEINVTKPRLERKIVWHLFLGGKICKKILKSGKIIRNMKQFISSYFLENYQ